MSRSPIRYFFEATSLPLFGDGINEAAEEFAGGDGGGGGASLESGLVERVYFVPNIAAWPENSSSLHYSSEGIKHFFDNII